MILGWHFIACGFLHRMREGLKSEWQMSCVAFLQNVHFFSMNQDESIS